MALRNPLRTLIASDSYPDIHFGLKLTSGNVGFENSIFTMPYFAAFLLKRLLGACDKGEVAWFEKRSVVRAPSVLWFLAVCALKPAKCS